MAATFPPDNLTTDEEISYLTNIRTTARRIFVGKLFKDRRRSQIPLPDGMEGRRWDDFNRKLDKINERNATVDRKTQEREGVIKRGVMQIVKALWKD
jgi:hypothetical protein